jgi:hypothetical protein
VQVAKMGFGRPTSFEEYKGGVDYTKLEYSNGFLQTSTGSYQKEI